MLVWPNGNGRLIVIGHQRQLWVAYNFLLQWNVFFRSSQNGDDQVSEDSDDEDEDDGEGEEEEEIDEMNEDGSSEGDDSDEGDDVEHEEGESGEEDDFKHISSKDMKEEMKKGHAVRNQLSKWVGLLPSTS